MIIPIKVAINSVYLCKKYQGSGFYTFLLEFLKALNKIIKNKNNISCNYYLFCPEKINLIELKIDDFYCETVAQTSKNYTNDILVSLKFKSASFNIFFLPHFELPWSILVPKKLKIIPLIHDFIPTLFLTPKYLFTGKTPHQLLTRRGVKDYLLFKIRAKKFKKIITISKASKDTIGKIFGQKIKSNIEIVSPGRSSFYKTISAKQGKKILDKYHLVWEQYLIYFGGYTVRKNVYRMIKAFNQIVVLPEIKKLYPHLKLVLVNGIDKKLIKVTYHELNQSILTLPKISNLELNSLLSGAVFSLYPSLFEGFGLPLIESIQAGTLPLVSDIPSTREILSDDYLYFNPYNYKEISKIITDSLIEFQINSKKLKKKLINLKQKITVFSWNTSANKLDNIFKSI